MAAVEQRPTALNGGLTAEHPSRAESFQSAISSAQSNSTPLEQVDTPATSSKTTDAGDDVAEDWSPPTEGPQKEPIAKPLASCKPAPLAPLTSDQQAKYATVLAEVSTWTTLPATTLKNAALEPMTEEERMWLTRECLLRYLRATKWNTSNALKRLQKTLSWRREYGANTFTYEYISPENETGKQLILGFDNECRPCLYLNPGNQNTAMSDRQIHHMCFMLDRCIDLMPPGQENSCLIINFSGASAGTTPSVGQARQVLNILQTHNPERLGKALITETPWYVNTFFKLISPFIDPVTREKMKFNEDLRKYVPPVMLWSKREGDLEFEYDHSVYWKRLEELTTERRRLLRERWENGGKRIGEYEVYLRGGDHLSLQQEADAGKVDSATAGVAKLSV